MKTCKDCQSTDLVPRGKYFRNQCHACWNKTQRERWAEKLEERRSASRGMYHKHAPKRREESKARKAENREYYSIAEWFRRNGASIKDVPPSELQALIEMKRALNESKKISNQQTNEQANENKNNPR
jgi:hypothetical protein